jgi:hypothetical protein
MQVHLKGQTDPVDLAEIDAHPDHAGAIVGTTPTGKRFVTRVDRLDEDEKPYRIYLRNGSVYRAVKPTFAEAEDWFLAETSLLPGSGLTIRTEDGRRKVINHGATLSLLSAMPDGTPEREDNDHIVHY